MYHFVYKTTNIVNGHFYIGVHSTDNIDDGYIGSGKRFRAAVKKYGRDCFSRVIVQYFDNASDAYAHERDIITEDMLQSCDCYNLRAGGHGGMCDRSRAALSASRKKRFRELGFTDAEKAGIEKEKQRKRNGLWTAKELAHHTKQQEIMQQLMWYTDGVQNTRAITAPGPGWTEGRSLSADTKQLKYIQLFIQSSTRQDFIHKLQQEEVMSNTAASSLYYRIKKYHKQLNEIASAKVAK